MTASTPYLGWGMTPLAATNVTPFTYRDNATSLELLRETRSAVNDIMTAVNGNANAYNALVTALGKGLAMSSYTVPVDAPTPSGGGFLYASDGALYWRGSGGTVTMVAPS